MSRTAGRLSWSQRFAADELTGRGCVGKCRTGPNLSIDGENFERVDSESLIDLLEAKLKER